MQHTHTARTRLPSSEVVEINRETSHGIIEGGGSGAEVRHEIRFRGAKVELPEALQIGHRPEPAHATPALAIPREICANEEEARACEPALAERFMGTSSGDRITIAVSTLHDWLESWRNGDDGRHALRVIAKTKRAAQGHRRTRLDGPS